MNGDDTSPATDERVPVTVLTGWLGAGKTTLLNRILHEPHGRRYAVIVNEFGEIGIDHELLVGAQEELFEMNNGCICCTVRGDLIRTLHTLLDREPASGGRPFDAVIVETTGLADPGPVAQTFFVDPRLASRLRLDSITTVVDAHHVLQRLQDSREAVEQVAFADQIVLNKTDLASAAQLHEVRDTLRRLNPLAEVMEARRCEVPLDTLLGRHGFDLQRITALEPLFLHPDQAAHGEPGHVHDERCAHGHDHALIGTTEAPLPDPAWRRHDQAIRSIALTARRPLDASRLEHWLTDLVQSRGPDILRAKGIIDVAGDERRLVFQAVHQLLEADWQRPWHADEPRYSRLVFIGRRLDGAVWQKQFEACQA